MDLDLENGGGGNNDAAASLLRSPDPADPQSKELQPCTWLRAAPPVVALVAGIALVVGGVALEVRSCSVVPGGETINDVTPCQLGVLLCIVSGTILAFAANMALTALYYKCSPYLPRLDHADDD